MTTENDARLDGWLAEQEAKGLLPEALMMEEQQHAVTPMDLLFADNYTAREIRDQRYETCKGCERIIRPTKTCKECGCFMAFKTWLKDASCPIGKW